MGKRRGSERVEPVRIVDAGGFGEGSKRWNGLKETGRKTGKVDGAGKVRAGRWIRGKVKDEWKGQTER